MKKFLLMIVALTIALSINPTGADAGTAPAVRKFIAVKMSDSLYVRRAGTRTDTTNVFTLLGKLEAANSTTADSTELFSVHFGNVKGSDITVGTGTTTFAVQGSHDNSHWVALTNMTTVTARAAGIGSYFWQFKLAGAQSWDLTYPFYRIVLISAAPGRQQLFVSYLVSP